MGARQRGFTLLELAIAVGVLALALAAGAWSFSLHPNALAGAVRDLDAAIATAKAVAASSGNGATIVFAPRSVNGTPVTGFTVRVYSGRPNAPNAVVAVDTMNVVADVSVREKSLGVPPFSLFIDSAGNASGAASYPQIGANGSATFALISSEPACPAGGFTLTLTNPQGTATQTRALSCRASLGGPAPPNPSPTPNVPLVTPTLLLFHWPGDAQQQFVATEWGYTHWFAAPGFTCGQSVAAFPDVLPSPYSAPASAQEADLSPSPPANAPYSYPNSGGASMNDAPAAFPLQPQTAGLCTASVQDDFGQTATAAVAVMGWLTATYGTGSATHASGTIVIPPSALSTTGSTASVSLAKSFDTAPLAPQVAFAGTSAAACASDLEIGFVSGTTPSTRSTTPATATITFTAGTLPPAALSCSGVIYNHYTGTNAPSDALSQQAEGVPFSLTIGPQTGPLVTLGKIVFWLQSGGGGTCSYAQLFLENGNPDANAPSTNDEFNHTDANGCVTNGTVNLWATEQNYGGQFALTMNTCSELLGSSAQAWTAGSAVVISTAGEASTCAFYVQSTDRTIANEQAESVAAAINSCSAPTMQVAVGTGCEVQLPISWGSPPDCSPGGSAGAESVVVLTPSPNPMLGSLVLISSNGVEGTYLWTRNSPGAQTLSYTETETTCVPGRGTHSTQTSGSVSFD